MEVDLKKKVEILTFIQKMYSNVQVMLKVKQGVYVTHISGPLCTLFSMLTGPQQPSVPQLTLTPDWHLWSYITSLNSPVTTSSAELSTEKKAFVPKQKAKTPHLSATLICFEFCFLSFYIDTKHDPGSLNDLQRREEKSVARQLFV